MYENIFNYLWNYRCLYLYRCFILLEFNFNWWQTITPELVDELFDENNKLRKEFKLGNYDLFKEWAKKELKEVAKKIEEETLQGKCPLSEATLKRPLGC